MYATALDLAASQRTMNAHVSAQNLRMYLGERAVNELSTKRRTGLLEVITFPI